MNATCERLRPTLFRIAEGDVAEHELAPANRHLARCTTCRIRLSRERRLAEILRGGLAGPTGPDEDFVRAVMARLPREARKARPAGRHGLKLAGLAGVILVLVLLGLDIGKPHLPDGAWPALPRLTGPAAGDQALSGRLGRLAAAVGVTVELARTAIRPGARPAWPAAAALALLLVSVPACAAATALGLAWRGRPLNSLACADVPDPRR
jgi:hypothetical protein